MLKTLFNLFKLFLVILYIGWITFYIIDKLKEKKKLRDKNTVIIPL